MSEALSTIPQSTIRSSIWFLEDDPLYATVKPYSLAFTPEAQIPRDNIQRTEVPVSISDLRGNEERFDLDLNGFRVLRFRDEHNEIDWDEVKMVEDLHYPRVVSAVEQLIPGAQCIALHHQIRKRDVSFPKSTGEDYTHGQPLRAAHIDMVRSSAEQLIQERLGEKRASGIFKTRYIVANVWHPLRGPNQDWPLGLCDTATLDVEHDLKVADYVTPTSNRENCLVHARAAHRWWYLSHQETTEAFLFRQYDSQKGAASGVPHASFFNPDSEQQVPRESIEVVVLIHFPLENTGV